MKRESIKFLISPYGRARSALDLLVNQGCIERRSVTTFPGRSMGGGSPGWLHLLVAFSPEVDDDFVRLFRQHSTPDTRLLIMNEQRSTDTILTRLLDLQIRSPQRLYVADCVGMGKSQYVGVFLQRLASALGSKDNSNRILDAQIDGGVLHVVSPEFKRLDVLVAQIPALADQTPATLAAFEIDEDGSFIYWKTLDFHLGWSQMQQIVDPQAARKALQKSQQFNIRYGKAVQAVREAARLKAGDIQGLSEKQLGRIEKGECRLTSNAMAVLAQAHGLATNEYLQKLAAALPT